MADLGKCSVFDLRASKHKGYSYFVECSVYHRSRSWGGDRSRRMESWSADQRLDEGDTSGRRAESNFARAPGACREKIRGCIRADCHWLGTAGIAEGRCNDWRMAVRRKGKDRTAKCADQPSEYG